VRKEDQLKGLKRALVGLAALCVLGTLALPASADSQTQDFEGFATGTPLVASGSSGWTYTGGSSYDVGIQPSGISGNSVRISNGVMSGSFGDWLFSKPLGTAATEGGQQEFTSEFDLASMLPDQVQDGLQISVAPQTGGGARMSFLKFADTNAGIVVSFSDVMNLPETVGYYPAAEAWRDVQIATLDRSVTHHVKLVMDLYPGPHNDVVQVYIDDMATGLVPGRPGAATFDGFYAPVDNQPTTNKAKAGQTIPMKWKLSAPSIATSWEDYYRYNSESNAGQGPGPWTTRQVDSLVFQARCAQAGPCANAGVTGNGFLIDNVSYASTATPTLPIATQGISDPSVYGTPVFTSDPQACDLGGDIDAIEVYAPGASGLMYHGNGVWQYNWQTPKGYAGHCVEMTLNLTGDSTSFRFIK
jgi:hypothetical protein